MNTELLNAIDEAVDQAEINVLLAIGESYCKIMTIVDSADEDVIQEYAIFNESFSLEGLKNLFVKAANFIKAGLNKIANMIEKRIVKDKRCLMVLGNMLLVADALSKKRKTITESFEDADSDDIYQEGLFSKKTENEKRYSELTHTENKIDKSFTKSLKKLVNDDIYHRRLNNTEINQLVNILSESMTTDDWKKFRNDINEVVRTEGGQIAKDTFQNLAFVKSVSEELKHAKYVREQAMINEGIRNAKEKHGDTRVKMDVKLVEKFQKTMGEAFNNLSKTKTFSTHQCMKIIYGEDRVKTLVSTLGNALFGLVEAVPKTVKEVKVESNNIFDFMIKVPNQIAYDMGEAGSNLYNAQHNFKDYITHDKWTRKEAGVSMNKTVEGVMFALDNLKEETWGYQDDFVFNYQAYSNGNLVALNMGGPFTMTVRLLIILGHIIAGDPDYVQTLASPGELGIGDFIMTGQAKLLSRDGGFTNVPLETKFKRTNAEEKRMAKKDFKESKNIAKETNKLQKELIKKKLKDDKKKKSAAKVVKESATIHSKDKIIEACTEMIEILHTFEYGIPNDPSNDYDNNYKLLSPIDFGNSKKGICFDYVEWEEGYLKNEGIDCEKWYLSTDIGDTHTFVTIKTDNGYVYPESAFSIIEGVDTAESIDDIARFITLNLFRINDNTKYDKIRYYVFKYEGHPEYGSDMKTCTEYFTTNEPVCEGVVYRS